MNFFRGIKELWLRLVRRPGDEELDEEIQTHLQIEIDEKMEEGMTPEEARYAARRKFGNAVLYKELTEEVWRFNWLDSLLRDVRYALRSFRNSPGFALTVIGTLALGLGALAASFSVFNALVLRPFAVRDPYSLYAFMGWGSSKGETTSGKGTFTWHEFLDFRRENPVFSEVLGYQNGTAHVEKKKASIQAATGNYFTMLGGRVCMGRALLEGDDDSGKGVAVASYAAWKSRFGADPGIVGKMMRLGESPVEIVGVACPEFNGPQKERVDFWVSLALSRELALSKATLGAPPSRPPGADEFPQLSIMGRLKPGWTQERAEAALLTYGRQAYLTWRNWPRPEGAYIEQRATNVPLNRDSIRIFLPLFVAFGLVLMIACVNVSNMMLARGLARRHEIGIRISLGAGRARMVRQLLTESLLLAIPAALAAFGVAYGIIRTGYWLLTNILPAATMETITASINLPSFSPDLRVLAFLLATALITTLVFGLMPAIQTTRSRLVQANRGEFEAGYRPARLRNALVIVQSTLCTLLLILAGVAMRNEMRIASLDLGLDTRGVFWIGTSDQVNRQSVLNRLSSLSSTVSIGTSAFMPLREQLPDFFRPKFVGENGTVEAACAITPVSPEYFDVYKIAVRGRKFPTKFVDMTESGPPDGTEVVISETAARRLWPSGDALGQTIETKASNTTSGRTISSRFPVVGVASDSVYEIYDSTGALKPNRAVVYFLSPPIEKNLIFGIIVVRMKGNPDAARLLLQKTLEETTPGEIYFYISSAQQEFDNYLYPFRAIAAIAGFLGAVALLMTTSGVFGMLSYVVTQRRKEFGIRIALGAGKARVTGMVLRQSLRLAAAGAVLGALVALAVARVLAHFVQQRFALFDAGGYAAGVLLVIAAALAASWIPATRAVNVDPARTLHCD